MMAVRIRVKDCPKLQVGRRRSREPPANAMEGAAESTRPFLADAAVVEDLCAHPGGARPLPAAGGLAGSASCDGRLRFARGGEVGCSLMRWLIPVRSNSLVVAVLGSDFAGVERAGLDGALEEQRLPLARIEEEPPEVDAASPPREDAQTWAKMLARSWT